MPVLLRHRRFLFHALLLLAAGDRPVSASQAFKRRAGILPGLISSRRATANIGHIPVLRQRSAKDVISICSVVDAKCRVPDRSVEALICEILWRLLIATLFILI